MTSNSRNKGGRLRIIGGEWRSRVLPFPDAPGLRPTPDRVRETLFNWLQHAIVGAQCLDLFAGSGALGFEALSRGAAGVVAVETDAKALAAIRDNARLLKTDRLETVAGSAPDWLEKQPPRRFDVVFLDPPFAAGLLKPCCTLLQQRGWLAPGARVYLESGTALSGLGLPENWSLEKEKRAGEVYYGLCRAGG